MMVTDMIQPSVPSCGAIVARRENKTSKMNPSCNGRLGLWDSFYTHDVINHCLLCVMLDTVLVLGLGLYSVVVRRMKMTSLISVNSQQANISWSLEQNINCSCHCKNKQGHCLHFIAIFLPLQFSWHTMEWNKKESSPLQNSYHESVTLFISKLKVHATAI